MFYLIRKSKNKSHGVGGVFFHRLMHYVACYGSGFLEGDFVLGLPLSSRTFILFHYEVFHYIGI
jgi:hypothetical protein